MTEQEKWIDKNSKELATHYKFMSKDVHASSNGTGGRINN